MISLITPGIDLLPAMGMCFIAVLATKSNRTNIYNLKVHPDMWLTNWFKSLSSPNVRLAWAIAMAADAIQIAALPFFGEGALSPADSLLDILVGIVLVRLLGWHWAFLPTLAAELIPGLDLFPTWTAAVWFVTRQRREEISQEQGAQPDNSYSWSNPPEPEILPPERSVRH